MISYAKMHAKPHELCKNSILKGSSGRTGQAFVFCDYCVDVAFATQYCLTAISIFSGTRGPSSWSTILVSHLIPSINFFTLTKTSTSSRNITAPSGRKIRSISRRMSSSLHLHLVITHYD